MTSARAVVGVAPGEAIRHPQAPEPERQAQPSPPAHARIVYRLATDADGPAIGKLFAAAAYGDLGVDWHRANVANGWLVADRDGEIVGAIQLCAGQPYSFLGDCVVLPSLRARDADGHARPGKPGQITLTLYAVALKMLAGAGAQVVLGVTDKPGMKRLLVRYGGISLGPTELFAKGTAR